MEKNPQQIMDIFFTIIASVLMSEFLGYWIHTLLHSEKIPLMSRSHMWHHIEDYGPGKNQRSTDYKDSAKDRFSLFGLGIEWLLPVTFITIVWFSVLYLIGVSLLLNLISIGTSLFWGYLLFGLIHEKFHLKKTWFIHNNLISGWFKNIRKLHDIHHHTLTDEGRMPYNMGICFYFFDRLFGTYRSATGKMNHKGLSNSKALYEKIWVIREKPMTSFSRNRS